MTGWRSLCVGLLDQSSDGGDEAGGVFGFAQTTLRSGFDGFLVIEERGVGGEKKEGRGVVELANLATEGEAVHVGQADVEQDQRVRMFAREAQTFFRRL